MDLDGNDLLTPQSHLSAQTTLAPATHAFPSPADVSCDPSPHAEHQLIQQHIRQYASLYPGADVVRPCFPPASPGPSIDVAQIPAFHVITSSKDGNSNRIPFHKHWWLPIEWFLRQLQWTDHPSNRAKGSNPLHYQSTFAELALACEIATGGGIADNTFESENRHF